MSEPAPGSVAGGGWATVCKRENPLQGVCAQYARSMRARGRGGAFLLISTEFCEFRFHLLSSIDLD